MIAPAASSVSSRLAIERYLLASPCVMARTVLITKPVAATAILALTHRLCAPEATMAIMSVTDRVAVVASHAHGSFGADMVKNNVTMSNTRTTPNWSLIRDSSCALARTMSRESVRLVPTGRAYPVCVRHARTRRRAGQNTPSNVGARGRYFGEGQPGHHRVSDCKMPAVPPPEQS